MRTFSWGLAPALAMACSFGASTDVVEADTGPVQRAAESDSGAPAPDPATIDADGDGWTPAQGDCDDANETISPDATDSCDGHDTNCDGVVDDEAWREDPHEPNDDAPTPLNPVAATPTQQVEAMLHDNTDRDRYSFLLSDSSWSFFTLDVGLAGIPDGATYALTLLHEGEVVAVQEGSGALSHRVSDEAFTENGGAWEIRVSALSGADCARRYLLTVSFSD